MSVGGKPWLFGTYATPHHTSPRPRAPITRTTTRHASRMEMQSACAIDDEPRVSGAKCAKKNSADSASWTTLSNTRAETGCAARVRSLSHRDSNSKSILSQRSGRPGVRMVNSTPVGPDRCSVRRVPSITRPGTARERHGVSTHTSRPVASRRARGEAAARTRWRCPSVRGYCSATRRRSTRSAHAQ